MAETWNIGMTFLKQAVDLVVWPCDVGLKLFNPFHCVLLLCPNFLWGHKKITACMINGSMHAFEIYIKK